MSTILESLIIVSEKAANIARACRQEQDLFTLLVQEKKEDEANARFIQDFKTLADVLIQETLRYDIGKHFPNLTEYIKGEESNTFTNVLGETIKIEVCTSEDETAKLLEKILNGDLKAARILASEVHKNISISEVNFGEGVLPKNIEIDIEKLGIWIDPIDSTSEYISGQESRNEIGIHVNGLSCVTVLIGAYDRHTGVPLIGVVNQPFHQEIDCRWQGQCYWGLCTPHLNVTSVTVPKEETKIVALSKIELEKIKIKLKKSNYSLVEASGAGYKLLSVVIGITDAYIVSQATTFRWDVCGPHAILRALGGGVFDFTKLVEGKCVEIDYTDVDSDDRKIDKYCNMNGLVAVKNKDVLKNIMQLLQE